MKPAPAQAPAQAEQTIFTVCKVCGMQLKRLTNSHLRQHGLTYADYQQKYEPEKHNIYAATAFLNSHYITIRYRFVEYYGGRVSTVNTSGDGRTWKLCDADLRAHINGDRTYGVYFPEGASIFIGLDIDSLDVELLNRVYDALVSYGIDEDNFLMTFSGKKGYHVDIFLDEFTDKKIIKKFYETLMRDVGATKKQIQLFGGGGQPYKLPLGYNQETSAYCCPVDECGNKQPLERIANIKKLSTETLCDIVDINYIQDYSGKLNAEFEELAAGLKPLPIYQNTNENHIAHVERLLKQDIPKGERNNSILQAAIYFKCEKGLCPGDAEISITEWIETKWSAADREIIASVKHVVRSVYTHDYKNNVRASRPYLSRPDALEILSVKTGNILETDALRHLYLILLYHSRAYLRADGVFSMSKKQMILAGARHDKEALLKQLDKLAELGKLMFVSRNNRNYRAGKQGQKFNLANEYKLPQLALVGVPDDSENRFYLCGKNDRCRDCFYIALSQLAEESERRNFIKGKRFKDLGRCEINTKAA